LRHKLRVVTSLFSRETVWLLQQETQDFISPDFVCQTVRLTTEFGDWCKYVYTLYKTPVCDTSD